MTLLDGFLRSPTCYFHQAIAKIKKVSFWLRPVRLRPPHPEFLSLVLMAVTYFSVFYLRFYVYKF